MSIAITSKTIQQNKPIPKRHTEDGEDLSPDLSWSNLPEGTKELALIVDDPDAPVAEPWVHWVIYKLAADLKGLSEGIKTVERLAEPKGALQGKNTWGTIGYRGPAPPRGHGTHHYHFKLYALDALLNVEPGLSKKDLLSAMKGRILAEGELIGTYKR